MSRRGLPPLRKTRSGQPFDGRFFEKDPAFLPLSRAARPFMSEASWPAVARYVEAFEKAPTVRFVEQQPRGRQRRTGQEELYDARIVHRGEVPTRAESWHDFLNALVWATFPLAKRALHERQLQCILEAMGPGSSEPPPSRTREHDALALLDEGGIVVFDSRSGPQVSVVFGHALFEALVFGRDRPTGCGIRFTVESLPQDLDARIQLADRLLAELLATARLDPTGLERVAF